MNRTLEEIEDDLDELQELYLDEEDEIKQLKIVSRFTSLLQEATDLDGVDRIAANINITNWTREL